MGQAIVYCGLPVSQTAGTAIVRVAQLRASVDWSILKLATVLPGNSGIRRSALCVTSVLALTCAAAPPADAPVVPLTVCEVVRDLPAQEGRSLPVLGRYSFRASGISLAEQACDPPARTEPEFRLVEDGKDGPRPPDSFELDAAAVQHKLADVRKRTSLGKFRFGTPDYDRWAVVYGRVQTIPAQVATAPPANLVFRGDGVVIFVQADQ